MTLRRFCRGACDTILDILLLDSLRPVRVGLCFGASLWSITLLLPGDTLERPVYAYMALIMAEWEWAALFGAVALLGLWRLVDPAPRYWWTLLVDGFSSVVFIGTSTSLLLTKVWPFPSAVSWDLVAAVASVLVLARTVAAGKGGAAENENG